MSQIVKIIDEREILPPSPPEKKTKTKQSKTKQKKTKMILCFQVRFSPINKQNFFNFISNLELTLSILLKQRELYESKHVAVECRCLKIWDLLSFLISSSILVLKWQEVLPILLELQLGKISKHQELGLYMKNNF